MCMVGTALFCRVTASLLLKCLIVRDKLPFAVWIVFGLASADVHFLTVSRKIVLSRGQMTFDD